MFCKFVNADEKKLDIILTSSLFVHNLSEFLAIILYIKLNVCVCVCVCIHYRNPNQWVNFNEIWNV